MKNAAPTAMPVITDNATVYCVFMTVCLPLVLVDDPARNHTTVETKGTTELNGASPLRLSLWRCARW
jgi:hypothetical protein